jgi:ubiquinone/menaquinone biosynthesis C-methylase UbiE
VTKDSNATHRAERLDINRALWEGINAQFTDANALSRWQSPDIDWGIFGRLESELQVLGDVKGIDVVELGCGTAYFSSWLARRGARPVGVDLSPSQLATAARCQAATGVRFPLIEANAEAVPLPDDSFDLAISEYGASLWCDPEGWVAEAARLLRPGGRLVFLTNSVLVTLCVPTESGHATERLQRPQRQVRQIQWPDGGVEFHPGHGEWVQILRQSGFTVEALHELYATDSAKVHEFYDIAMPDWAQQWPVEDLWVARLRG